MVRIFQFSKYFFMMMSAMFLATPAFAQAVGGAAVPNYAGIAVGIGMGLAAGQVRNRPGSAATASATEAMARNPGARPANPTLPDFIGLALHRVARAFHLRVAS